MWRFKDSPELGFIEMNCSDMGERCIILGAGTKAGLRLNTAGKACV